MSTHQNSYLATHFLCQSNNGIMDALSPTPSPPGCSYPIGVSFEKSNIKRHTIHSSSMLFKACLLAMSIPSSYPKVIANAFAEHFVYIIIEMAIYSGSYIPELHHKKKTFL